MCACVHEHVVDGVAVLSDCHGFEVEAVAYKPFCVILSEQHLLSVAQMDCALFTHLFVGEPCVDALVEYHTVLRHFHNGCAFVASRCHHNLLRGVERDVEATGEELATGAKHGSQPG